MKLDVKERSLTLKGLEGGVQFDPFPYGLSKNVLSREWFLCDLWYYD